MKVFALASLACLVFCGCGKEQINSEPKPKEITAVDVFNQRIEENGHLSFESWNGKLRRRDSDIILHFLDHASAVLVDYGIGVSTYEGSYVIHPTGKITVGFVNDEPYGPFREQGTRKMILSKDGEDLLLHREDGHTSWLPKGDSASTHPSIDGFWPLRATPKKHENLPIPKTASKQAGDDTYLHLAWFHNHPDRNSPHLKNLMLLFEKAKIRALTESNMGVASVYVLEEQEEEALRILKSNPDIMSDRIMGLTGYRAKYLPRYNEYPGEPAPLPTGFPKNLLDKTDEKQ